MLHVGGRSRFTRMGMCILLLCCCISFASVVVRVEVVVGRCSSVRGWQGGLWVAESLAVCAFSDPCYNNIV